MGLIGRYRDGIELGPTNLDTHLYDDLTEREQLLWYSLDFKQTSSSSYRTVFTCIAHSVDGLHSISNNFTVLAIGKTNSITYSTN